MDLAIEAARRAFLAQARGEIETPLRSALDSGRLLVMPAVHRSGSLVLKLIAPEGPAAQGADLDGLVLWMDAAGGGVTALLDVSSFTARRTGAASGLATQLLAPAGARTLAMLGTGVQAEDQVEAVLAVRPISEVRLAGRDPGRARDLAGRLAARFPEVSFQVSASMSEAVEGAQVVCSATRATSPLFAAGALGAEVHLNAVGAFTPEMAEVPPEAFGRADLVVVDQRSAALAEAGDVIQAMALGQLGEGDLHELGELLQAPPARRGLTLFKSVGIAAQDWAMAELVVGRARQRGLLVAEAGSARVSP